MKHLIIGFILIATIGCKKEKDSSNFSTSIYECQKSYFKKQECNAKLLIIEPNLLSLIFSEIQIKEPDFLSSKKLYLYYTSDLEIGDFQGLIWNERKRFFSYVLTEEGLDLVRGRSKCELPDSIIKKAMKGENIFLNEDYYPYIEDAAYYILTEYFPENKECRIFFFPND